VLTGSPVGDPGHGFGHEPAADHPDPMLNSTCSIANPARQVAASNGIVCSTVL
jgi:hypothetical protein